MLNYEPGWPTRLKTHTGPLGLAAVLLQEDPKQKKRWLPVATYSRVLTASEESVSILELELIAA